ncbi:hypothetical protein ACFZB5_13635 [Streptomyces nodosus]|uniref:hypothetical protein n=1 Tax=Streptomyces nodosus TaxID=40318 RepID=UPI0036EA51B1
MAKTKTGTVYALTDPRDDGIRYIGKTTQELLDRLGGHLASPTNPAMRVWINALGAQGLVPNIKAVTTTTVDKLDAEEKRQIEQHAQAGHRLLNSPYYHRNLGAVFAPAVNAVAPVAEQCARKRDEFSHRLYGPIAAARAAGRMPQWKAALHVLLRAPVVGLAHIWFSASGNRVLRPLAQISGVIGYCWVIGFDGLAKDYVVVHLPVAEFARFWSAYLAGPLHTLCWHVLAFAVLEGCGSYISVAEAAGVPSIGETKPQTRPAQKIDLTSFAPTPLPDGVDPFDVAAAAAAVLESAGQPADRPRRP